MAQPEIPQGYDIETCKRRLQGLIDAWPEQEQDYMQRPVPWPRRESIQGMMKYFFERYCKSPASSTHKAHGAFEGGLLIHSTLIFDHLRGLLNAWGLNALADSWSVPLVAYFHDFGKCGDMYHEYYLPKTGDEKFQYEKNDHPEFVAMAHDFRSIMNLNNFGVPLLPFEFQAIMHHSLGWSPGIRDCESREHPLTIALGNSDLWIARIYRI